jgi:signal transduction histidine kinase
MRAPTISEQADAGREITDIVAHTLGAVLLQLAILETAIADPDSDGAITTRALTRARHLALSAFADARQGVGILRPDAPPLVESLQRLVDARLGTLVISGWPTPTNGEAFVALHRTVEESLTNVAKHAPGANAHVHLDFATDAVVLTISDDGISPDSILASDVDTEEGCGLTGLRERAMLIGGSFSAGHHGRGWQVKLILPREGGAPRGDVMREWTHS